MSRQDLVYHLQAGLDMAGNISWEIEIPVHSGTCDGSLWLGNRELLGDLRDRGIRGSNMLARSGGHGDLLS
jgi:hypothetical protein